LTKEIKKEIKDEVKEKIDTYHEQIVQDDKEANDSKMGN
jgi:uncharacterized coiled-coil DUF342 family protein